MPPEPPPLPVTAWVSVGAGVVTCRFDRPLTPGPGLIGAWTARANLGAGIKNFIPAAPPVAAGTDVTWPINIIGAALGTNVVSYHSPPGLLAGVTGTPVAEFLNFPLAVLA